MHITDAILTAAATAAETMGEGECVHVHADGTCTTGTDGKSTRPGDAGWGDVVYTFDPARRSDDWDCFEPVE